ncbi:MAG: hypothetical protein ACRDJH_15190 [Thermomicrobiales bacterium]
MTDYLLVMAMMAIALIAVLIAYVLDNGDDPTAAEESELDPNQHGHVSGECNNSRDSIRSLPDAPEQSG